MKTTPNFKVSRCTLWPVWMEVEGGGVEGSKVV